jgi:hypothetical protein
MENINNIKNIMKYYKVVSLKTIEYGKPVKRYYLLEAEKVKLYTELGNSEEYLKIHGREIEGGEMYAITDEKEINKLKATVKWLFNKLH